MDREQCHLRFACFAFESNAYVKNRRPDGEIIVYPSSASRLLLIGCESPSVLLSITASNRDEDHLDNMQFKQFLGAALAVIAVRAQDNGSANLTSVLSGNDNLSSLVTVLNDNPDVAQALSGAQNITVLAPSNQALRALNSTGGQFSQQGFLQALLNYHVLIGNFTSDNITETPTFAPTLLNDTAFANVTGGQVVELRMEDNETLAISGFKNNASVTEAVSTSNEKLSNRPTNNNNRTSLSTEE